MLRIAGAVVVLTYALICAAVAHFERDLIYPVPNSLGRVARASVFAVPEGTNMLWVPARPEPDSASLVAVYFHGNADQIAHAEWLADAFHAQGLGFAAVEYPGYPGTPGEPSEASLMQAAEAAMRHLAGPMGIANERLILVGQSLGSGVAVQLAAKGWGRQLVLLTPYTSLKDLGAEVLPLVPVRLLMKDDFDSATRAPLVHQRVLIVHGTDDEVIPFAHGRAMAGLFKPPAVFVPVRGGLHNDLWDRQIVHERVFSFILSAK